MNISLRKSHFRIVHILAGKVNFQMQYQLTFCLWCMTFNEQIASKMQRHGVIPVLSDILAESSKEKVHRIILAVFRVRLKACLLRKHYLHFAEPPRKGRGTSNYARQCATNGSMQSTQAARVNAITQVRRRGDFR